MQTVNGALPLFIEMTRKASDAVKQTGVKALVEFAKHSMSNFRRRNDINN